MPGLHAVGESVAIGRRIAIIGTTGSGKTTLARELAKRLGAQHVELDALFWESGWRAAPNDTFRERVAAALRTPAWVSDGNYNSRIADLVWRRAETLIWLDLSFPVVFRRLVWRTMTRIVRKTELWNSNRETWRSQVLSRDSLFVWILKSHRRNAREWTALLADPQYAHLRVVRLGSPRAVRLFLASTPGGEATASR